MMELLIAAACIGLAVFVVGMLLAIRQDARIKAAKRRAYQAKLEQRRRADAEREHAYFIKAKQEIEQAYLSAVRAVSDEARRRGLR